MRQRVLMLAWEYPPHHVGGLGRHVFHLSRALADLGVEVTVVTRSSGGSPLVWNDEGVTVIEACPNNLHPPDFVTWAAEFNVSIMEEIAGQLKGRDFDLVHAHDWIVAYAAAAVKRSWGVPLVATIHATEQGRQRGLHTPMQHHISETEWWLCYEACRVITCSGYMKDEVCRAFRVPGDKVRVIPNGISDAWFDTPRAPSATPLVAFVGRTVPEKGPATAVDAMLQVVDEFPDARLILAGDGPMDAELQRGVYRAGLGKVVELAGRMDDARLKDLYSKAWVAVFPSSYEPFGIVSLEAMAAGTPCVVGAAGGLPEIVHHGRTGLVVEPGNPTALAEAIQAVFRDPEMGERLAARAREVALTEYSWVDIGRKTVEVYEEVRRSVRLPAGEAASAVDESQAHSPS